jgi:DNA-binding response OmpR family regulator
MTKKRILVVEDDNGLAEVVCDNLVIDGYEVDRAADGNEALERARRFSPDLVILDVMLPGRDGFEICGLIRRGGRTPVIMVTARVQQSDKLRGLDLGADDYVTKPFDILELLARVRAVLRRVSPGVERLELGPVTIDFLAMTAFRGRVQLPLVHREFDLLHYLADRRGRVVYRDELLREVWAYPDAPMTRSVDHAIARLRKKIEVNPSQPRFILTMHGDGYCLAKSDDPPPVTARGPGRAGG